MSEVQIAVVLGFAVSMGLQLLKRVWPGLDCSEAIIKQIVVVLLAGGAVLAAAHWQINLDVAWQAVLAAVAALATHKALLKTPEDYTFRFDEEDQL